MKIFDIELIKEQARSEKIGLADAEKDYVLSVALAEISKLNAAEHLVFKGGTCLKKIYFPNYRFSSDLDFSALANVKTGVKEKIVETFQFKELNGVKFLKIIDKTEKGKSTLRLSLQYESKIGSIKGKPHVDSIWMDFNFDSGVSIKPVKHQVILPAKYTLSPLPLLAMDLREILAEKISAVHNRPKPRDLYDLWFLLKENTPIEHKIVNNKLQNEFDLEKFKARLEILKPKWDKDMKPLLQQTPNFDQTAKETVKMLHP